MSAVTGWTSPASGNSAFEMQKGATQGVESGFMPTAATGVQYLELNTYRLTSISQIITPTWQSFSQTVSAFGAATVPRVESISPFNEPPGSNARWLFS
ncbi:hypothetical protein [Janthinobacterium sp. RB2R34]|uniref:hypothetical protein n=1 Tax=Janthinobacterium sp. RB2R34 TaxID=3424193 RepID=UPI003F281377